MRPGSFARVTRFGSRSALIGLLVSVCVPSAFASWRAGGIRLLSGRSALEELSTLSDGAGGFVISISDTVQSQVYLQRGLVEGEVAPGWPAEGIAVETSRGGWRSTWPDGDGGVFVTWREIRSGRSRGRAQHLLADGTRAAG